MKKPPLIWTNVVFFSISFLAAVIAVPWYGFSVGYTPAMWCAFVGCMFYAGMSITGGYHRLWAHKTYDAHPVLQVIYALGGAFALQNSALHWSSDHRRHHGHVDHYDKDPYAATRGFWFSHIGWMLREYQPQNADTYNNVRDLQKNSIVMWQHRYYFPLAIVMNVGLPILLGVLIGDIWGTFLLAGVLRLFLSQHVTFFINSLAHIWGKRPYTEENTARDNAFLALITYGEGYHNYHHLFSGDYRNGVRWYHYDPTKWMIKGFSYIGMTEKLKSISNERIEQSKAKLLFEKASQKLQTMPDSQSKLVKLQDEYAMFIKQLKNYANLKRKLLNQKKSVFIQNYEKDFVKKQLAEIKEALIVQKKSWLMVSQQILKAA